MLRIKLSFIAIVAAFLFVLQSCEEDGGFGIDNGGNTGLDTPMSLSMISESGTYAVGNTNVGIGEVFTVKIKALAGSQFMDRLTIREEGEIVSLERITLNGSPISGNPKLLLGDEKMSFEYVIDIVASFAETSTIYTFEILDEGDDSAVVDIDVSTISTPPMFTDNSSGSFQVAPGALLSVNVDAIKGSADLAFIIIADVTGTVEDHTRFYYGDINTPFDDNPFAIPVADKAGFNKDILIRATETGGPQAYRIFLIDENEEAAFFDIDVIVGSPVTEIFGVLFNAAGVEGTGGLDLDEGFGTGSQSALAEIKDEGIDLNQPVSSNWKTCISGVNGSEMKQLIIGENGLAEGYSFTNSFIRSDLKDLFDVGISFTATNADGELVSHQVKVGDSYAVRNGETYYLIYFREVNQTTDDNEDNYLVDIKL